MGVVVCRCECDVSPDSSEAVCCHQCVNTGSNADSTAGEGANRGAREAEEEAEEEEEEEEEAIIGSNTASDQVRHGGEGTRTGMGTLVREADAMDVPGGSVCRWPAGISGM